MSKNEIGKDDRRDIHMLMNPYKSAEAPKSFAKGGIISLVIQKQQEELHQIQSILGRKSEKIFQILFCFYKITHSPRCLTGTNFLTSKSFRSWSMRH